MSEARSNELSPDSTRRAIELAVRLVLVGLLAYWCFRIFRPFLMPLIWGVVLAVALAPIYLRLEGCCAGGARSRRPCWSCSASRPSWSRPSRCPTR